MLTSTSRDMIGSRFGFLAFIAYYWSFNWRRQYVFLSCVSWCGSIFRL